VFKADNLNADQRLKISPYDVLFTDLKARRAV